MTSPAGKPATIAQKARRKISLPWFRQASAAPPHVTLSRQHTIDTPSSFQARLLRRQPSLAQVPPRRLRALTGTWSPTDGWSRLPLFFRSLPRRTRPFDGSLGRQTSFRGGSTLRGGASSRRGDRYDGISINIRVLLFRNYENRYRTWRVESSRDRLGDSLERDGASISESRSE